MENDFEHFLAIMVNNRIKMAKQRDLFNIFKFMGDYLTKDITNRILELVDVYKDMDSFNIYYTLVSNNYGDKAENWAKENLYPDAFMELDDIFQTWYRDRNV